MLGSIGYARILIIALLLLVVVWWVIRSGYLRGIGATAAVLYMVTVDASLNVFSAQNSSPQTTELFAKDRKTTLMKYVYIGDATTLGLGLFASLIASSWWPLAGAVTVTVFMHALYVHAAKAGQNGTAPAASGSSSGTLRVVGGSQ
jgi:hypothetical protein